MASAFAKSGMNQGRSTRSIVYLHLSCHFGDCMSEQVEYGEGRGAQKKPGHNYPGT